MVLRRKSTGRDSVILTYLSLKRIIEVFRREFQRRKRFNSNTISLQTRTMETINNIYIYAIETYRNTEFYHCESFLCTHNLRQMMRAIMILHKRIHDSNFFVSNVSTKIVYIILCVWIIFCSRIRSPLD